MNKSNNKRNRTLLLPIVYLTCKYSGKNNFCVRNYIIHKNTG